MTISQCRLMKLVSMAGSTAKNLRSGLIEDIEEEKNIQGGLPKCPVLIENGRVLLRKSVIAPLEYDDLSPKNIKEIISLVRYNLERIEEWPSHSIYHKAFIFNKKLLQCLDTALKTDNSRKKDNCIKKATKIIERLKKLARDKKVG